MFISRRRLEEIEARLEEIESRIEDIEWTEKRVSTIEDKVGSDHTIDAGISGLIGGSVVPNPSGLYKRIHLLAKALGYEYSDVEIIEGFTKIKKGKK